MTPSAARHRPFRPRRGPVVAVIVALACLIGFIGLLLTVGSSPHWNRADKVFSGAFLAVGLFLLYRQASVVATPDEAGLTVRNFLRTRRLDWAQIISVRFGQGRPWVRLDLADGTEMSVMAIQSADGSRTHAEAMRLAALVQEHEATGSD